MTAPPEVLDVARAAAGDLADGLHVEDGFGPPTLHVPAAVWRTVLLALRDRVGLSYFDWLSAVDELDAGFSVVCHVARLDHHGGLRHLLVATTLPRESPTLDSLVPVWEGAAWHERETHEMFGIAFVVDGVPVHDEPLLLPDGFEGHPLRKDFVLASRVAKAWPGAKEPGESDADSAHSPSRRRVRPPGVPDDWLQQPVPPEGEVGRDG